MWLRPYRHFLNYIQEPSSNQGRISQSRLCYIIMCIYSSPCSSIISQVTPLINQWYNPCVNNKNSISPSQLHINRSNRNPISIPSLKLQILTCISYHPFSPIKRIIQSKGRRVIPPYYNSIPISDYIPHSMDSILLP